MKNFINIIPFLLIHSILNAQVQHVPSGFFFQNKVFSEINKAQVPIQTAFKPILQSDVNKMLNYDSILYNSYYTENLFKKLGDKAIVRKIFYEDFISIQKNNFKFVVNPLFYLEKGNTVDSIHYFINTRGIEIKGDIGDHFSFYSNFRENQARFRSFIYDKVKSRLVVPGQGAVKLNNNDLSKFDFSSASAYLSWTPSGFINVQIGQDKHFIGEGYRSFFISDFSSGYPFAKIKMEYKNFQYSTLFTEFRDFRISYYDYHFKKHGAFNYISYNYLNRFEVGLFEGVIYKTTDTIAGYVNRFKADYFIPVLGLRSLINGFGSENHLLVGMNVKVKVSDFIQLYGQFAIDDMSQKKYAFQNGIKMFDLFFSKLKNHRLYVQTEYNYASPRAFSHPVIQFQTWSNYNEELAHPAGSDFSEIIAIICHNYKRVNIDFRYNTINLNRKGSNSDIFVTDDENYITLPNPVYISHYTTSLSYIVNPTTGLQIYVGFDHRNYKTNTNDTQEIFLMFGLKSDIANFYYDY